MLAPGQLVPLTVEKAAAGGSMIARVDGQVVLVAGAIPGEQVTARIDRVGKGVAYAQTVSVDVPSADRREAFVDPLCGGSLYTHIAYQRQLGIKAEVVADAFARIGRIELPAAVAVRPSPESGYRMRARLHVRGGHIGFFREGTHEICDAGGTRQLLPATADVLERLAAGLRSLGLGAVREIDVSENLEASERAVHFECASPVEPGSLGVLARTDGVTGLSVTRFASAQDSHVHANSSIDVSPVRVVAGDPHVTDVLSIDANAITLRRHVRAFFQGNRFLLRDLVAHVVGRIEPGCEVVDLYAGVGLFAVSAALARGAHVVAVEGDPVAARDLETNARASGGAVESVCQPVEVFTARTTARPRALIVDPPRTGLSREALAGVLTLAASRLVYVSCDVATLARDARRLGDAGYALEHIEAFDLFPNTPHVETVVVFDREKLQKV